MSWKITLCALALAVVAACSKGSKGIAVNARTDPGGAPGTASALDLGNGIVLERVRLAVKKVEVEGGSTSAPMDPPMPGMDGRTEMKDGGGGEGDDGGDGEGEDQEGGDEREFGPFLVDLSGSDLTGGIHFQFKLDVPDGTYEEVSFRIDPVSADAAAAAPVESQRAGLAELASKGASVVVNGTSRGASFELAAAISAKQENEGSVVVDANGAALTLNVDASRWFLASDGTTVLDPSDAANAAAIAANVQASIHVENGDDHHGG